MDLIRQIKETETRAKQTIDRARADADRLLEQARKRRAEQTAEAQRQRREAIERASESAQHDGQAQAEQLTAESRRQIQVLGQRCEGKIDACVQRVLEAVRNLQS